jgi:hypothetical protein
VGALCTHAFKVHSTEHNPERLSVGPTTQCVV